jgi:hypothetical protein
MYYPQACYATHSAADTSAPSHATRLTPRSTRTQNVTPQQAAKNKHAKQHNLSQQTAVHTDAKAIVYENIAQAAHLPSA